MIASLEHGQNFEQERREQLGAILNFFNLGKCKDFSVLTGGIANINYLVTTDQEKQCVVKILIVQKKELLENDLAIQDQLAQAGVDSVRYLQAPSGSYLYESRDYSAVVSPKVEGEHPEKRTPEFCYETGKVLAQFHTSVHTLPQPHEGWLNQKLAKQNMATAGDNEIEQQTTQLIVEGEKIFEQDLPKGIIHGDLHDGNILVRSQSDHTISAIMDFEEAEENVLLVDLARTIIGVCSDETSTKMVQELMDEAIRGYESVRVLSSEEKENLLLAIKYVAGTGGLWLYQLGFPQYATEFIKRVKSLS